MVVIAMFLYLTLLGAAAGFAIIELRDQQKQIVQEARQRTYQLCVTSNQARESLRDLLLFAEERTKQSTTDPEQLANALDFYDKALARIEIIPCPEP